MPRLQKLADQYKNRSDVQFITFNSDDNPGLIQPFLKDHHISLVVIPAHSYMIDTLKVFGVPQDWIVDAKGVVRLKGTGYDASEKWVASMKEAIDKVKPAAAAASAAK